jgi:hypothetical protein
MSRILSLNQFYISVLIFANIYCVPEYIMEINKGTSMFSSDLDLNVRKCGSTCQHNWHDEHIHSWLSLQRYNTENIECKFSEYKLND